MPPRSRQTRHQDVASRSRQGHIIDLDPTDGLPVQKYGLQKVIINQDASTNLSSTNPKSTSSAEWTAQFKTDQHPWAERPLPSYFADLSPWNQELIRKARAGNTNPTVSQWDRKNNAWVSGAEQERKSAAALKGTSLNNNTNNDNNNNDTADSTSKPQNGNDAASTKSDDESGAESSSDENKSGEEDDFDGDETAPFKTSTTKRRKVTSRHQGADDTRTFEVTRWIPLPASQADKVPERTYLAPRRPGMPPLYAPEYAQKMFGHYHSSATLTGTSGYDLGEGGGLNNASGVLAAGSTNDGTVTPRKNIPPRRKKKKLGGPGRKKANPTPGTAEDGSTQLNAAAGGAGQAGNGTEGIDAMEGVEGADGQAVNNAGGNTSRNPGYDGTNDNDDGTAQDDGEGDESGSEAEGSEEGEIDESGGAENLTIEATKEEVKDTEPEAQSQPEPEPEPPTVTITATPVEVEPVAVAIAEPLAEPVLEPITVTEPVIELEPKLEPETETEPVSMVETTPPPAPSPPPAAQPISEIAPPQSPISPPLAPIETAAVNTSPPPQPDDTGMTSDVAVAKEQEQAEKEVEGEEAEVDFLGVMDAAIDREVSEGA